MIAMWTHCVVDVLQDVLVLLRLADDAVGTHRNHRRSDRPDVEIVHRFDPWNRLDLKSHGRQRNVRRRRFEQDVHRLADQAPGTSHDQNRGQNRRNRVCRQPTRIAYQNRRDQRPHAREQISQHVQVSSAGIHVIRRASHKHAGGDDVDDQAAGCNRQHQAALDNRWRAQAIDGFPQDPGGNQ